MEHLIRTVGVSWKPEEAIRPLAKLANRMGDERRGPDSSDFGALLRHYRLALGLSQGALAERARLSLRGVNALERGRRRAPQRETLESLAGALALNTEQRRAFEMTATAHPRVPRRRGTGSVTVGPWPSGSKPNLPFSLTSFIGRDAELDEVRALVREHRLVTITGAGGVGKTQTALRAATALSDAAEIAVCFVELAPIGDPSLVATAIATALGVQEVPNHPLLETLVAFLKNKTALLLLDNSEHVIGGVANVADFLLHGCPNLRIMATSREPLQAAGERSYRLPSLDDSEAVALFADRAQAADAHFTLTDGNRTVVAEICRHLSGIPLAIELAAARVTVLPLPVLAKALDDRFAVLARGERTAPARQQTMRATIDWSYELLTAPEQRLFERLSVFVGGSTIDAATAVCHGDGIAADDVLSLISSLVSKSLVVADFEQDEARYRLLEPFRQYASERLASRGEREATAHGHARAYLELAHHLRRRYEMDSAVPILLQDLNQQEAGNWRAALHWTLRECGDVILGQHLACAAPLGAVERRSWIWRALELVSAATPMSLLAELRYVEAIVARVFFERETQLASSELAIVHYREAGNAVGVARAQTVAGHALESLGRATEATSVLQTALAAARTLGDRLFVAYVLRVLAHVVFDLGNDIAARTNLEEALRIYENLDAKVEKAWALEDLAEIEFRASHPQPALRHATEMLRIVRELNPEPRLCVHALSAMSLCLMFSDRFDESASYAREALDLALENSLPFFMVWNIHHLAATAVLRAEIAADDRRHARVQAARLLGFVDARLISLMTTPPHANQLEHDHVVAMLKGALGIHAAAMLMAQGATMSEDEAVEMALEL